MKYKNIPNTNIQIPAYMPIPAFASARPDLNLLARNAEIARRVKAKYFGGGK